MTVSGYVLSIQHTGTWFTIEALRSAGIRVMESCEFKGKTGRGLVVLHSHICTNIAALHRTIADRDCRKFIGPEDVDRIVRRHPVAIPLRDPLRSIITRRNRHPELSARYIVDGFLYASSLIRNERIFWLPVDLPRTLPERIAILNRLAAHFGHSPTRALHRYAWLWKPPPYNVTARTRLNDLYNSGAFRELAAELPEVRELHDHRGQLRGFLEQFGYRRLLWW